VWLGVRGRAVGPFVDLVSDGCAWRTGWSSTFTRQIRFVQIFDMGIVDGFYEFDVLAFPLLAGCWSSRQPEPQGPRLM